MKLLFFYDCRIEKSSSFYIDTVRTIKDGLVLHLLELKSLLKCETSRKPGAWCFSFKRFGVITNQTQDGGKL